MVKSCQHREIKSLDKRFVTTTAATLWILEVCCLSLKTFAGLINTFLRVYLRSSHAFYKVLIDCFANNVFFFRNNTHNVPLCFTVDNFQTELFY